MLVPIPVPVAPAFAARVDPIDDALAAHMTGRSYHDGCPVPLGDLRVISVSYWGPDGEPHPGRVVAHADAADALVRVFGALFELRFPLTSVEPVDAFAGDDGASMAADNTSAFNCRPIAGGGSWSQHAFGRAIDVNPLVNPYVSASGRVRPPGGAAFLDRTRADVPGMIRPDDAVVRAFAAVGWRWGGAWRSSKDWQHFSANGR